jgi:tetratricopeptide (TPR) repeat protein
MSDLADPSSQRPRASKAWKLMAIVCGLASLLYAIIMILPFTVNTRQRQERSFLTEVDHTMAAQQYADARRSLEQRMAEGFGGTEWALRLGICQSMQENYDEARRTLDGALADDPCEPRLLYNRALLDYRQRNYDDALHRLKNLVELAPYFPGVRYHIGRICEIHNQPQQALQWYVQELNVDPASSSTWRRYLYLRQQIREADEANPAPNSPSGPGRP